MKRWSRRWPHATVPPCRPMLLEHLVPKATWWSSSCLNATTHRAKGMNAPLPLKPPPLRPTTRSPRSATKWQAVWRSAGPRDAGRGAVLARRPRPLRHRRVDLPGHAHRCVRAAQRADVKPALDICRDLKVPIVPRGGGTSQCGQTVGAGLVIDHSKHVRNIVTFDADQRSVTVEPGMVLDHLNAEMKRLACGSRWTCPPAPRPRSAAWRATTHVAAAALPGATWCQRAGRRRLDVRRRPAPVRPLRALPRTARALGEHGCRALARRCAPRSSSTGPRCCAACRLQPGHLPQSERSPTPDGSVNLAHLLVGSEGTLALTRRT